MTNINFLLFSLSFLLVTFHNFQLNSIYAQTEIYNAIQYNQISDFQENYSIVDMKMSADASKIIFSTGGSSVKIFTINTDGTGLLQIYDFQTTGSGSYIDISGNGDKVIWNRYNELYIANADGSNRKQLAELLPNPNPNFADFAPDIPLPPRITLDGSQVYFINRHHDPLASGVWRVNADGSNIHHLLDYMDIAGNVFGTDGSEYAPNSAFTNGFDISGDGSILIFGTTTKKVSEGDYTRGDAIVFNGGEFYNLGEFATGFQPFCTDSEGNQFIIFKREYNASLQSDVINVYYDFLGTGEPIKVIKDLDQFGISAKTQMSSNGSTGIIIGGNGRLPITFIERVTASHLDVVSMDGISRAMSGFNFSESYLPSIAANGEIFCFLSTSIPNQIWVGKMMSAGTTGNPEIGGIFFEPNYVLRGSLSTSHFKAHVISPPNSIIAVTAETFKDGSHQFRGIDCDNYPDFPRLVDDGNLGDSQAGDHYFNNNIIKNVLEEIPLGEYSIRIAAVNSTLRQVTAVDAGPFSILDEAPTIVLKDEIIPNEFNLSQNYPNPFNPITIIKYSIPNVASDFSLRKVTLIVYDVLGREVLTLLNRVQKPGNYQIVFDASKLTSGIYFYGIFTENFTDVKKMILMK